MSYIVKLGTVINACFSPFQTALDTNKKNNKKNDYQNVKKIPFFICGPELLNCFILYDLGGGGRKNNF